MVSILLSLLFSPLASAVTLDDAVRSALEKSESARQSQEQLLQAEERLSQATGAILPNVALHATHQVQAKPTDPIARAFFPEKQTTANLTLTQPLFRGFREFAGRRARQDLFRAEEHRRTATLLAIYENVAAAYLDVLALERDLKNLGQQRELYKARVKDLQGRIRRGESRSTEALTAQSTEAALEAEYRMVSARLQAARESFALLTALPATASLTELKLEEKIKPLTHYLSKIEERPDIKEAKERVSAGEEEVSVARGAHWPTIDAVGNYYFKRPDGVLQDVDWDVQFRLTLPLFEGGLRVSETREANSRLRESELSLSRLRREAEAAIRSLHHSLETRADQLAALKRASELAEKNYEVLQRENRRGLARSLDVQVALTDFRASRRGYDQARYAHLLDLIRLENAAANLPASVAQLASKSSQAGRPEKDSQ